MNEMKSELLSVRSESSLGLLGFALSLLHSVRVSLAEFGDDDVESLVAEQVNGKSVSITAASA